MVMGNSRFFDFIINELDIFGGICEVFKDVCCCVGCKLIMVGYFCGVSFFILLYKWF